MTDDNQQREQITLVPTLSDLEESYGTLTTEVLSWERDENFY